MNEPTTMTTPRAVERKASKGVLRPQTVALAAIAVVFGLLLWAKLLLVTGHPRTALADPDDQQQRAPASVDQAGPSRPAAD